MGICAAALLPMGGCDDGLICEGPENCPADSACVDGACRLRACFDNSGCPMEQYCELESGQCQAGCTGDRDCYFGAVCSGGSCVDKPCTSTNLDCDAGQFCDVYTGTCYDAAAPYCARCDSDDECGGGNNECLYVSGEGPFCLPECNVNRPCPAGYSCVSYNTQGDPSKFVCVTLCHYLEALEAQGISGRVAPPPLSPGALPTVSDGPPGGGR